jgi:hypothetical protein
MLKLVAQPIQNLADLRAALQNAVRLEHSTIPPYLTALATLSGKSPSVAYARQVIRDIVVEEMLHMTLACNLLNAVGGHPQISGADFVPSYPHELPMGVAGDLVVHLKRYSKDLVQNTFMRRSTSRSSMRRSPPRRRRRSPSASSTPRSARSSSSWARM